MISKIKTMDSLLKNSDGYLSSKEVNFLGTVQKQNPLLPFSQDNQGDFDLQNYYIEDNLLPMGRESCKEINLDLLSHPKVKHKTDPSKQPSPLDGRKFWKKKKFRTVPKKPCTYFFSSKGCKYGENCYFDHTIPPKRIAKQCWFNKFRTCHFKQHCWFSHTPNKKEDYGKNKSDNFKTKRKNIRLELEKLKIQLRKLTLLVNSFRKEKMKVSPKRSKEVLQKVEDISKKNLKPEEEKDAPLDGKTSFPSLEPKLDDTSKKTLKPEEGKITSLDGKTSCPSLEPGLDDISKKNLKPEDGKTSFPSFETRMGDNKEEQPLRPENDKIGESKDILDLSCETDLKECGRLFFKNLNKKKKL